MFLMEKKATASEHLPSTSSPDMNLPLEQSAERDNNSCNFVNLVSGGRTHHGFRDGDLHGRSSMTGHSSYSDFTGNSTSEAEPTLFQQSAPNTCLSFHPYIRRVRHVDDGTVGRGFQFDIMPPVTIGDVTDVVEIDFIQGEAVISNMSSNAFQPSSLPSYPQMPDTDSGIMGGNCQIDKNCDPLFGRKYAGLKENKHVQIGFNNRGEHVSSDMMPSTLQQANLNDSQTIAPAHLCSGPASLFQTNHGKQSFVSLDQSINHEGHTGCSGPLSLGHKNNSAFMIGPGDQIGQAFNFGQNQHLVIPWSSSEPYTGLVSNIDEGSRVYCTGGAGYNQLSTQTGMSTNVHNPGENKNNSVANPFAAQMLAQHTLSDQNTKTPGGGNNSANANCYYGSGQHAANCYQGLATRQMTVQDSKLLNANKETLLPLFPDGISRDPALGPVTVVDGRIDLNAEETQTKMVRLTQPSCKGFSPVTTQGSGGRSIPLQNAICAPVQARTVAVNPSVQASGNKGVISRSDIIKASQAPCSKEVFIPAPQGEVAPSPARGRAQAETPSRRGKPQRPVAPPSSLRRRAVAPGLKNMEPSATTRKHPDVIRRSNASSSGSPAPLGARCDLCGVDLAFSPSGAASGTCGDPPASAVHPCGHRFHDACLREIGVSTDCEDPPCIACGFIQKTQAAK